MASKGRKSGIPNYKKDILLNVIESILPVSSLDWEIVASRYQEISGESVIRDHMEIKRQFNQKLCNRGVKPTGNSGANSSILKAQKISYKILKKEESCILNEKDSEDEFEENEEEELEEEELEEEDVEEEGNIPITEHVLPDVDSATTTKSNDVDNDDALQRSTISSTVAFFSYDFII